MDYTFNGRLRWVIHPQSLLTDLRADTLEMSVLDVLPDLPEAERRILRDFKFLLSCTENIILRDGAKPALQAFKAQLESWTSLEPVALWAWRTSIPHTLMIAWGEAWADAQSLFDADPAALPLDALTPEQRDEADTPGSPLASAANSSPNPS